MARAGTNEIGCPGIRLTDTLSTPTPASVLLNRLLARGKFRHLQVLLRLAELGSVQRAADAIGVTQSSVTQTLAYLEALLDVRLFQRHARGVTPTAACVDLLPVARQVMLGVAEGADVLVARQRRGGGIVRLLASSAGVHSVLLDRLAGLPPPAPGHPGAPARSRGRRPAAGRGARRGRPGGVPPPRGRARRLGLPPAAARPPGGGLAPGHAVLKRRRSDWKTLGREQWMLAPAETAARRFFDEVALQFGAPPRTHPLVSRVIGATLATLQRDGVLALLPHSFVRHAVDGGQLALVPMPSELPLDPIGVMRPRGAPGAAAALLVDHLLQAPPA
jgi:DNA-binding transcriptional LysR family regulator